MTHGASQHDGTSPRLSAAVLVSSDRSFTGAYEDLSGPAARDYLTGKGFDVNTVRVVPDDAGAITEAVLAALKGSEEARTPDLLVISGGTGLGPRDITPQTLDKFCDYHVPGIGEMLRRESLKYSLNAYLSRCGGWVRGATLILALPGNPKAVVEQLEILADLLPHALMSVRGECKHRRKTETSTAQNQNELSGKSAKPLPP